MIVARGLSCDAGSTTCNDVNIALSQMILSVRSWQSKANSLNKWKIFDAIRPCSHFEVTPSAARTPFLILVILSLVFPALSLHAATGGSISGTIADPSGAVVAGATLKLVNTAQQTIYRVVSDRQGLYGFPNLPVGRYDLTVSAEGFTVQRKTNLNVDADSSLRMDIALAIGAQSDTVTVTSVAGVQVDTSATHLGEVVSGPQMSALPLNGRSYTDLLAIQPGVAPISTLLPSSVIMAGVTGGLDPSGDLNPGNLSINGQRESSNGFMVNGIDVQEHMNGGTSIIPNLDSIEEFRVLTNDFDPDTAITTAAWSPLSASQEATHFTEKRSSFSVTRTSMPGVTSIPPCRPLSKTSLEA